MSPDDDDVRMLTISEKYLHLLLALPLALVHDLDSVLHPSGLVDAPLAHTVAALSYFLTKLIFLQEVSSLPKAEGRVNSVGFGTLDPHSKASIGTVLHIVCVFIKQRGHIAEPSEQLLCGSTSRDCWGIFWCPLK